MNDELLEDEIFNALDEIRSDRSNEDRYGQVGVCNYTEYAIKKRISKPAFDFLKAGKSVYGTLQTYGGRLGTYKALSPRSAFYQKRNSKTKIK